MPGFLTHEYLQGRRARWISPIRLYLIFSVAFFALSAITPVRVGVSKQQKRSGWSFSIRSRPQFSVTAGDNEDAAATAKQLGYESIDELRQAVNQAWITWTPRVMFVLVPLFAWLVAFAYRRVDRNYLHHLIVAFHLHAAWFAVAALAAMVAFAHEPAGDFLETLVVLYLPIYAIVAFGRVYGRVRRSFVRIAFVLVTYWIAVIAAIVAIVLPVVLGRN